MSLNINLFIKKTIFHKIQIVIKSQSINLLWRKLHRRKGRFCLRCTSNFGIGKKAAEKMVGKKGRGKNGISRLFNQMIQIKFVQRLNPINVKKNSHKNIGNRQKITLHIIIFSFGLFSIGHFFHQQFFPRPFFLGNSFQGFFSHGHFFLNS